jgi:hypothetical protein
MLVLDHGSASGQSSPSRKPAASSEHFFRSAHLPWQRKPAPPGKIYQVENLQKFFVNPAARAAARSQEKFKGEKVKCRCRVRKSQAAKCRTNAIQ